MPDPRRITDLSDELRTTVPLTEYDLTPPPGETTVRLWPEQRERILQLEELAERVHAELTEGT